MNPESVACQSGDCAAMFDSKIGWRNKFSPDRIQDQTQSHRQQLSLSWASWP